MIRVCWKWFSLCAISFIAWSAGHCTEVLAEDVKVSTVKQVPTEGAGSYYQGNRAPLQPSPLAKLPIGSITPKGWLRKQLETEAVGMTGRLAEISPWLKDEKNAWIHPKGQGCVGWEEMPYWLKGYGDLGYVLKDPAIQKATQKWVDTIISGQQEDGWIGPEILRTSLEGKPDLWSNMLALNILQSYYEATNDQRAIDCIQKYLQWELNCPEADFMAGYWAPIRAGDNFESVYWLYNRTGEKWLLDLAEKIHRHAGRWDSGIKDWHGVNISEGFREPGIYWMQAKKPELLKAAYDNYSSITDMYGQFPGGGIAADENCRGGFTDPRQATETCAWVEFMHSFEILTKISGDPLWADRCEEIAFNSFPASQTPDQKGLHYLTAANMVQLDRENKAPALQDGGTMLSYSPFEVYRCCQHNVSHGWPYYAEELWLATADRGLCASLYAASEVSAKVGDGTTVKIAEETNYPFDDTVTFKIALPKKTQFPLYFRIPRWCQDAKFVLNGKPIAVDAKPLSYVTIDREWTDGDVIGLRLPMTVSVRRWAKNHNAASVDYGPLTFSLKIGERWQQYGSNKDWPEWEVFPTTPWNYGLVLNEKDPAASFEVVREGYPESEQLFTSETAPITIKAKAKQIPGWKQDQFGLVGKLPQSPVASESPEETVTLIPMGAARLRISAFPVIGPKNESNVTMEVTASQCYGGDTMDCLLDNDLPELANEMKIPRFTWWAAQGSPEWIQYDFGLPKHVSAVSVYWFDDSAVGGLCRAPQTWRLLYKDGDAWKPVDNASDYGTEPHKLNRVTFKPVETTALRIEAQLRPGLSSGMFRWYVQ